MVHRISAAPRFDNASDRCLTHTRTRSTASDSPDRSTTLQKRSETIQADAKRPLAQAEAWYTPLKVHWSTAPKHAGSTALQRTEGAGIRVPYHPSPADAARHANRTALQSPPANTCLPHWSRPGVLGTSASATMMSPRSFLLAHRQGQHIAPAPAPSAAPSTHTRITTNNNNTSSPTPKPSCSSLSSLLSTAPSTSARTSPDLPLHAAATTTSPPTFSPLRWSPKYDEDKNNIAVTITSIPVPPNSDANMGKRKDRRETLCLSPSSPPTTTTSLTTRPTTPTSPVKIPTTNGSRPIAHPQKRHTSQRRRPRDSFSPESISPSLVALLAVTDIPRPGQLRRRRRRTVKSLTVDEIIDCQHGSEKGLSWSLSKSPLDMLLSPPQDAMDDDDSVSDCNLGYAMSTRTYSMDSIPSLDDSFTSDGLSSFDTPRTPSPLSRRSRSSPMRKSLEPVLSPPGSVDEHPLAGGGLDDDDFEIKSATQPEETPTKSPFLQPFKPLRSAFKSNLTASLRALRSAAKSFSAINFPSIPPDDFLTRSILTIDPNVPYADERRPPVLEEIPSEAMRRYLNPTTNSRIESPSKTFRTGTFAASIQMRTYKIQRSRSTPPSSRNPYPSTSLQTSPAPQQPQPQAPTQTALASPPGMRQREMRENSDFIRIAVMEMAMRKRGKLDDQRPGRARWALPPRKMTTKPYEVASDGVPVRWIPISS
ncbi:hypothetical protein G7Z17_g4488 [Cylindrodendrum hubeiense]|uniref:Uncharacterized protein n=1 Tax=Cylindrodendrum hubeiense TaxID=595255 RepID=A0A9P5HGS4_9HYPO|nr:hypothetical protein G7Z17_g4488 [Cylindrodendrum hubeiense]